MFFFHSLFVLCVRWVFVCFLFRFCGTVVWCFFLFTSSLFSFSSLTCAYVVCAVVYCVHSFYFLYRNTIIRFFFRPIHLNEPNEFYAILLGVGCLKCNIPNALLCSQRGGKKRCGLEWFIEVHGVFMHSGAWDFITFNATFASLSNPTLCAPSYSIKRHSFYFLSFAHSIQRPWYNSLFSIPSNTYFFFTLFVYECRQLLSFSHKDIELTPSFFSTFFSSFCFRFVFFFPIERNG